ncbi:MAG: YceI family protein [Shewanellaceae bacterium]|nr:YceI family protein [Shewanellaceae bacterium]
MQPYKYVLISALFVSSSLCSAAWQIDEQQSVVNFSSTKTLTTGHAVTENHEISSVVGQVDDQGHFNFKLDTRTVNTHIPLRDARLKQHLFHTAVHPWIQITGQLTPINLSLLSQPSTTALIEQPFKLDIDGHVLQLIGHFNLKHTAGKTELELNKPLVVSTNSLEMSAGMQKLTQMAGLASIKTEVPVQIHLELSGNAI